MGVSGVVPAGMPHSTSACSDVIALTGISLSASSTLARTAVCAAPAASFSGSVLICAVLPPEQAARATHNAAAALKNVRIFFCFMKNSSFLKQDRLSKIWKWDALSIFRIPYNPVSVNRAFV